MFIWRAKWLFRIYHFFFFMFYLEIEEIRKKKLGHGAFLMGEIKWSIPQEIRLNANDRWFQWRIQFYGDIDILKLATTSSLVDFDGLALVLSSKSIRPLKQIQNILMDFKLSEMFSCWKINLFSHPRNCVALQKNLIYLSSTGSVHLSIMEPRKLIFRLNLKSFRSSIITEIEKLTFSLKRVNLFHFPFRKK